MDYQDLLTEVKPEPTNGKKRRFLVSDLPSGMNDSEAYWRAFIPTVSWYMGTQQNIWVYDNKEFCGILQNILSAVYTSAVWANVTVDGAIFSMVSNHFLL